MSAPEIVEIDVRAYLLTKSYVTNITSTIACSNVDQGRSFPRIVIRKISGGHEHTLDGSAGFATPRIQFMAQATSYVTAKRLAYQIRMALQGFRGTMNGNTVGSVTIEDDVDLPYEPPINASDVGVYPVAIDALFHHQESLATL